MHKMKASILLLLAFAQVALAGSADAIIKGKTGTGRTQFPKPQKFYLSQELA
jgi:hypothetical protein